jgi:ATP-binding cassette, subfamily B, multidrug efflux pump
MFGFFEKRIDPFPESRLGAPPRKLFRFIWHYVGDAWPWLALMSGASVVIAVGEVVLFAFLGQIVDLLAAADRARFWSDNGPRFAWMSVLLLVVLPAAVLVQGLAVNQVLMANLTGSARWRIHRHLLSQSMAFFANEFAGRISTKLMQTAQSLREVSMKILDVLVYVCVYFLAMLATVAIADWRLIAPLILWLGVYIGLLWWFIPRLGKAAEAQADTRSAMTGRIVDSYTNIATVKLFAHAGREEAYAKEGLWSFLLTGYRQMRLITGFQALTYINNSLVVFLIGALAIHLWMQDLVTIGAIAIGIALALRLNGMSQWIMWEVSQLFENVGVIHDGSEMLTRVVDISDKPGAATLNVPRGAIDFEQVAFHYGKQGGVIEDVTLHIRPGEKVGLVGRSGAGKSTLVNLLLRFYDVESGRISIDGQGIADVTQESLRASIGVVTQDTSLLHRSIRDNIAYGRPDASEADIGRAARRANALGFIEQLADQKERKGFDAHVGERGVKLSGGQRQRIAIARIFLKDAPILVLDEATSALDSEVEGAIQEHLFELMQGKTVISIAHRLSTIAAMDRLIVLDAGRVVEQGAHDELVAAGGLYAELWRRQSGGFLVKPEPKTERELEEAEE